LVVEETDSLSVKTGLLADAAAVRLIPVGPGEGQRAVEAAVLDRLLAGGGLDGAARPPAAILKAETRHRFTRRAEGHAITLRHEGGREGAGSGRPLILVPPLPADAGAVADYLGRIA